MLLCFEVEEAEEEEAAELLRLEMNQRDIRKSTRTIAAPTHIPSTTHKRKPKIEVRFESWSFKKLYSDIVLELFLLLLLVIYMRDKISKAAMKLKKKKKKKRDRV